MLFPKSYGIILAFLAGKREYPNEEMIAELKAQLLVKETRMRKLARLAEGIELTRENLPAVECYAVEMRSLVYQMRLLMSAKAAALAAAR